MSRVGRFVATAVALVLLVLAMFRISGSAIPAGWTKPAAAWALAARLPLSMELLLVAGAIAVLIGLALVLIADRWRAARRPVDVLASGLQSIPYFCLAPLVFAAYAMHTGGTIDQMYWLGAGLDTSVPRVLVAASVLALYLIPLIVAWAAGTRTVPAFLRAFAVQLPQVVGTAAIVEIFFGWRAEGRLLLPAVIENDLGFTLGCVLIVSVAIAAVRQLAVSDV